MALVTSVAGVPFQDLWAWKCPSRDCKVRLVRSDERLLEREATAHWHDSHAELDDQMGFDFPPDSPPTLRAV